MAPLLGSLDCVYNDFPLYAFVGFYRDFSASMIKGLSCKNISNVGYVEYGISCELIIVVSKGWLQGWLWSILGFMQGLGAF